MAKKKPENRQLILKLTLIFLLYAGIYLVIPFLPLSAGELYVIQGAYYMLGLIAAVWVTGLALLKATKTNRFFWLAIFGGTVMFLASEMYWVVYDIIQGVGSGPPHPSFCDFADLTAYLFLYIAVVSMSRISRATAAAKARYLVDTIIVIVFATIIYWALILAPILAQPNLNVTDTVFTVLYQLLDIGLLFGVLANLFGFKVRNWRIWEAYIAAAIMLRSVADFGYAILVVNGTYEVSNIMASLTDISWLASYFLFAVAGIMFLSKQESLSAERAGAETLKAISKWQEVGVVAVIAIGLPFYVMLGLTSTAVYERWGFAFTGALAIALAVLWGILVIQENSQLMSNSIVDQTTGLFNFEFFRGRLEAEISRAKRFTETLCIVVIDINGLEQINNTFGYPIGDAVLEAMGQYVRKNIRLSDVACRIGSDEVVLILPETDKREVIKVCHAIQADFMESHNKHNAEVVLSWGIAEYPQDGNDIETLLKKADDAIYWHKFYDNSQVCLLSETERLEMPAEVSLKAEKKAYLKAVMAMAAAIDARDPFTRLHSKNVARMAKALAEEMGLADTIVKLVETAALVHDVGKIGIPDRILRKPEPLSAEDRVWVQEHPVLGERMLSASTVPEILPWIAAHHEQWDGTGYPKGLEGERIPIEAAILGVCDAYDAMTSDRSYRKAMTSDQALAEINKHSGRMFNPDVAQAFIEMIVDETKS